jgi:hypothetical protein
MSNKDDVMSALRRLANGDNFQGGGTPDRNKRNDLYNNLNELNKMQKDGRLRPDGEFQLYPKNPKFYVSPGEYKKGNLGSGQYAFADGGSAGRDNFAGGGAPAPAAPASPAQPINSLFDTKGIDNDRAFLSNMYQGILGRAPDEGGLDYWHGQLESGDMNEQQIFKSFAESPEFQGLYKNNPNDAIGDLYQYSFNRAPDQGGLDYWLGQAKGGMGLGDMVNAFNNSQEGQNMRGINDAYFSYGNDLATKDQMSKALAQVSGGKSVADVSKNIKNDLFVNDMHKIYLGRDPDPSGYDYYMGMLKGDNNPFAVRDAIAGSQEAKNRHHHIANDASNLTRGQSPTFTQASSDTVNSLLGGMKDYQIPNVGRDLAHTGVASNLDSHKLARLSSIPFTSKDNVNLWGQVGTAAHNYDFSNSLAFTRGLQKIGVPLQAALAIAANGGVESGTSKGYMPWAQTEKKGFKGQGTLQFTGPRGDNYRKVAENNGGVDSLTGNISTIADELKGNKRYREVINAAAQAKDLETAIAIINKYYEIGGHQEDSQGRRAEFGAQLQKQYDNYAKDNPFQAYSYEPPLLTTTETQDSKGGVDPNGGTAGLGNGDQSVPAFTPTNGTVPAYLNPTSPYYNYTPPDQVITPEFFNPINHPISVTPHPAPIHHQDHHHNQNHHIIVGPLHDISSGKDYGGSWDSSGIHSKIHHTSGHDPYFGHDVDYGWGGAGWHDAVHGHWHHYDNNNGARKQYGADEGYKKGGRIKPNSEDQSPDETLKRLSRDNPPNFPDGGNSRKMLRSSGGRTGFALDGRVDDEEHNKHPLPMMAQNNEAMQRAQTFAHDNEADKLRETAKEPSAWDYFKTPLQFAVQSYVSPDVAPQRVTKALVDAPQTVTHFGKGLAESAYSGATLPGDVASGKVDPASEEGFKRVQDLAGLAQTGSFAFTKPAGALASGASREAEQAIPAMTKSQSQDAMKRLWELGQGDTGGFKNWNHQWNVQEAAKFKQQIAPENAPAVSQANQPHAAPNVPVAPIETPYSVINPAGFYSQGHHAAMTMLPEGPRSWQEMLAILSNPQKGNVKAEELKWAGLLPDAYDQSHKITREEIADKFKQNFPQTNVVWQRSTPDEGLKLAEAHAEGLGDMSASARSAYIRAHNNDWRDALIMHDLDQVHLTPEDEARLRPYGVPSGEPEHYLRRLYVQRNNPDEYERVLQTIPESLRPLARDAADAHWRLEDSAQQLRRLREEGRTAQAPKWESYTHDGGENYSISALTVPYNSKLEMNESLLPEIRDKYKPQIDEANYAWQEARQKYQQSLQDIGNMQERYERENRGLAKQKIAEELKANGILDDDRGSIAQRVINGHDWKDIAKKIGDEHGLKRIMEAEEQHKALQAADRAALEIKNNLANAIYVENANRYPAYTKQLYQHQQHLGDVKNPLLHQRWKDRVGPNGEKIFSNEELQSDVGQQGREEGFINPEIDAKHKAIQQNIDAIQKEQQKEIAASQLIYHQAEKEVMEKRRAALKEFDSKSMPPGLTDKEVDELKSLQSEKSNLKENPDDYLDGWSRTKQARMRYLEEKNNPAIDQSSVIRAEYQTRIAPIADQTEAKVEAARQKYLVHGDTSTMSRRDLSNAYEAETQQALVEETNLIQKERKWLSDKLEEERKRYNEYQDQVSEIRSAHDNMMDEPDFLARQRRQAIEEKYEPQLDELREQKDSLGKSGTVPLFPHVGTTDQWTELGVKHALAHAIENGYDQIFVMGGQEHARRYADGLRQAIKDVTWESPAKEIEKYYKPVTELLPDRQIVESQNAQGQKLFAVEDAEGIRDTGWEYSKENAINSFVNNYNHRLKNDALSEYYADKLYGKPVSELNGRQVDRVSSRVDQHVDDTHRFVTASSADNEGSNHTFQVDPDGKVVSSTIGQAVGKKLSEVLGGISKDVMKEDSGHIPLDNYRMNSEGYTQHYERKVPSTYKDIIKKYLKVDPKIEAGPLLEKGKNHEVPEIGRAVPGTGFLDRDENNRFRVSYPDGTYRDNLTESQAQRILDTERQAAEQGDRIRITTFPIMEGGIGIGNNNFYVHGGDLPGRMFRTYQEALDYYRGVRETKLSAPSRIEGPQGTAIHITPEMREAYHRIKKQRGSVFPAYKRGGSIEDPNDQHAMEVVRNLSRRAG